MWTQNNAEILLELKEYSFFKQMLQNIKILKFNFH